MTDHTPDSRIVREHFLGSIISSFNLVKGRCQQQNRAKANSVTSHTLVVLNQPSRPAPTMSELTSELEITKQQLTKLVNNLEGRQLVERQHGRRDRRRVCLAIAPTDVRIVQQLREAMLSCTMAGFSDFTKEELSEMDGCLVRLPALLNKFDLQKPQGIDYGDFPQIQDLRNLTQYARRPLPLTGDVSASGQGQWPCYT